MDNRTRLLLERCSAEIKQLRNENTLMSARLDMFDKMMLIFHTQPNYPGQGMSEDICWQIEKHIESETIK